MIVVINTARVISDRHRRSYGKKPNVVLFRIPYPEGLQFNTVPVSHVCEADLIFRCDIRNPMNVQARLHCGTKLVYTADLAVEGNEIATYQRSKYENANYASLTHQCPPGDRDISRSNIWKGE